MRESRPGRLGKSLVQGDTERMADGIGPNSGYDISVDGINRTFRDRKAMAIEAALVLKTRGKGDMVKIRDRETGQEMIVLPDGRIA